MSDSSPATPSTAPATTAVIAAELIGTFWLVLGGCGTAVFAAVQIATADTGDVPVGVGYLGVAIAFGLTVLTGAYAFGHISGGHFNPAVTIGAAVAGRLPWAKVPVYIVSQSGHDLSGNDLGAADRKWRVFKFPKDRIRPMEASYRTLHTRHARI